MSSTTDSATKVASPITATTTAATAAAASVMSLKRGPSLAEDELAGTPAGYRYSRKRQNCAACRPSALAAEHFFAGASDGAAMAFAYWGEATNAALIEQADEVRQLQREKLAVEEEASTAKKAALAAEESREETAKTLAESREVVAGRDAELERLRAKIVQQDEELERVREEQRELSAQLGVKDAEIAAQKAQIEGMRREAAEWLVAKDQQVVTADAQRTQAVAHLDATERQRREQRAADREEAVGVIRELDSVTAAKDRRIAELIVSLRSAEDERDGAVREQQRLRQQSEADQSQLQAQVATLEADVEMTQELLELEARDCQDWANEADEEIVQLRAERDRLAEWKRQHEPIVRDPVAQMERVERQAELARLDADTYELEAFETFRQLREARAEIERLRGNAEVSQLEHLLAGPATSLSSPRRRTAQLPGDGLASICGSLESAMQANMSGHVAEDPSTTESPAGSPAVMDVDEPIPRCG